MIYILKYPELKNSRDYYLSLRATDREERYESMTEIENVARLIYMLIVNFKGLYRVNS
ncbi:hypothetical protein HF969_08450 [Facklamia miroungae]|nr:hypothetical protein [Facklamia miroungae]